MFDEACTMSGLQMHAIGKTHFFFKYSNLNPKQKHDFLLQVQGDRSRYEELMQIISCSGLAQNFGAVASLVTTGIQQGHMKMHLMNIMNTLECTHEEKAQIIEHFKTDTVSVAAVTAVFKSIRGKATKPS